MAFCSFGQIASDSFEGSSIFTITNGAYKTGNSAAADGPSSSPFSTVGTQGYGCNNTTVTMISPVYDVSCYTNISLSIRLAAFSLTNATNGMDASDNVQVFISTNGGGAYTNYLQVNGNSNAYWAYSATGLATTAYPTVTAFTPAGGGSRTTDGYSTLTITSLPASGSLVVKIVALNNSANELWVLDDFKLLGTFSSCGNTISTGTLSASSYSVSCSASAAGTVTFTSTGTFNAGNVYTAQMSDASGNFSSPVNVGTFTSTANSGTINITIPAGTPSGTGYHI